MGLVKRPVTLLQLLLSPPHTPHLSNFFLEPRFPSQPALMHLPWTQTEVESGVHRVPSTTCGIPRERREGKFSEVLLWRLDPTAPLVPAHSPWVLAHRSSQCHWLGRWACICHVVTHLSTWVPMIQLRWAGWCYDCNHWKLRIAPPGSSCQRLDRKKTHKGC